MTLGGGGLGQGWGASSEEEAVATVHAALAAGINLIDTAPMYGTCEAVIAAAFQGVLPAGVRITTKCQLGAAAVGTVATKLEESLDASLEAMRLDHVDVYFLHSNICEDDTVYAHRNDQRGASRRRGASTSTKSFPAFEDLKRRGRIGAWGITGIGVPGTIIKALEHDVKPSVVQAITNLLDSPGGIRRFSEAPRPRAIIAAAKAHGVGVMGIRAVQAGALTAKFDRRRQSQSSRCRRLPKGRAVPRAVRRARSGPGAAAHRYALDMEGVDTVVLGVKNRAELAQCLEAEALGSLPPELRARIDGVGFCRSSRSTSTRSDSNADQVDFYIRRDGVGAGAMRLPGVPGDV